MDTSSSRARRVSSASASDACHEPSNSRSEAQKERVSTACSYCRHRKVKCDGKKPMCTFCQHLGRESCEYTKVSEAENQRLRRRKRELRARRALERQQRQRSASGSTSELSLGHFAQPDTATRIASGKARDTSSSTSNRRSEPFLAPPMSDFALGRARSFSGVTAQRAPKGNVFAGSMPNTSQVTAMSGLPRELRTTFSSDTVPSLQRPLEHGTSSAQYASLSSSMYQQYDFVPTAADWNNVAPTFSSDSTLSPGQMHPSPATQMLSHSAHGTPTINVQMQEPSGLAMSTSVGDAAMYSPQTLPTAQDFLSSLNWTLDSTPSLPNSTGPNALSASSLVRDDFLPQMGQNDELTLSLEGQGPGDASNTVPKALSAPAYTDHERLDPFFGLAHEDKASPGAASAECPATQAAATLTPSMLFGLTGSQMTDDQSTWAETCAWPRSAHSYPHRKLVYV